MPAKMLIFQHGLWKPVPFVLWVNLPSCVVCTSAFPFSYFASVVTMGEIL